VSSGVIESHQVGAWLDSLDDAAPPRSLDLWVIVGLTPEDEHGNRSARVIDRSEDCKDRDVCVEILTEDDGDRLLWTKDRPAGLYKLKVRPYGDGDSYELNVVWAQLLYDLAQADH
jgi:hypothetical protein